MIKIASAKQLKLCKGYNLSLYFTKKWKANFIIGWIARDRLNMNENWFHLNLVVYKLTPIYSTIRNKFIKTKSTVWLESIDFPC